MPRKARQHQFSVEGYLGPELKSPSSAVIVGGSLAGLMSALSLAREGLRVTILERSANKARTGAALPVREGLLQRIAGKSAGASLPSGPHAWADLHAALRSVADAEPNIEIHSPMRVESIDQDAHSAWASTEAGEIFRGDIVIGADGHASVVRRYVAPSQPDAIFAGYVIWLGIEDEASIKSSPWPSSLAILNVRDHCLNAYYLPGREGSLAKGKRRLGFGWYDSSRNDLVRKSGAVVGNVVRRTLRPADIPRTTFRELASEAHAIWPDPWREVILRCLDRRAVIGTPIGEYMPERLVRGRVCVVGDAAHLSSPMTGRGFDESALDALALAESIRQGSAADALQRYDRKRLLAGQELVRSGYSFSRSFAPEERS